MSNSSGASGIGEIMVNKGKEGKAHVVTEKSWKWGVWKEKFLFCGQRTFQKERRQILD